MSADMYIKPQAPNILFTVVNMSRLQGASALAKAAKAVPRRDAERIEREKRVQDVLADFYHAQGEVERIHCEADAAAATFGVSMREAVRALDSLGESRAGLAGLTGLTLVPVREYLAETSSASTQAMFETASVGESTGRTDPPRSETPREKKHTESANEV